MVCSSVAESRNAAGKYEGRIENGEEAELPPSPFSILTLPHPRAQEVQEAGRRALHQRRRGVDSLVRSSPHDSHSLRAACGSRFAFGHLRCAPVPHHARCFGSPPAQSGCTPRSALSVSLSPLAEFGSTSPTTSARPWAMRKMIRRRRTRAWWTSKRRSRRQRPSTTGF